MKFSIIVPTYNEERDIGLTLETLLALEWDDYEILIVDDSTDRTPQIVRDYINRGVRLIIPEKREGRCGARNRGIIEATGDVVVILNADVHLPIDFLKRIESWYDRGYDYVLVRSAVENVNDLFARYVECMGIVDHYETDPNWMEWSEGFSCRREIAIQAGMFPVGFAIPICAGEDGYFGANLRAIGARKKIDLDIVVTHVAPGTLSEYWDIRKGRGRGSPQIRRFLDNWSWPRIIARAALRVVKTGISFAGIVPMVIVCYRAAKQSPRGQSDLILFCWAWLIEQVAFHLGEWASIIEIWRAEAKNGIAKR